VPKLDTNEKLKILRILKWRRIAVFCVTTYAMKNTHRTRGIATHAGLFFFPKLKISRKLFQKHFHGKGDQIYI
jgi:hypothetical protein